MADKRYSYHSDDDVLASFIADHIKTRHTVEVGGGETLVCVTCGRIAKVYGDRHASEVLYENRPRNTPEREAN